MRPSPTTPGRRDEPADVYVVITVRLEKNNFYVLWLLIFGTNTSVRWRRGAGTGTGTVLLSAWNRSVWSCAGAYKHWILTCGRRPFVGTMTKQKTQLLELLPNLLLGIDWIAVDGGGGEHDTQRHPSNVGSEPTSIHRVAGAGANSIG